MSTADRANRLARTREAEIRRRVDRIVRTVRRYLPGEEYRILLCGSWATGEALTTSDIDLAIDGSKPVDERVLAEIRSEIDWLPTLRKVDLIDLATVGARFRYKVLRGAEIVA